MHEGLVSLALLVSRLRFDRGERMDSLLNKHPPHDRRPPPTCVIVTNNGRVANKDIHLLLLFMAVVLGALGFALFANV